MVVVIVEWLLDAFQAVVEFMLAPLPTGGLSFAWGWLDDLAALNYFLPIAETFAVVIGVMVVFPVFAGVNFALWAIALLRGGSSRG